MTDEPRGEPTADTEPLTQREVIDLLVRDRAARAYATAAVAALAMVFLVLFMNGSDIGAVLVALIGASGLVLRWIGAPALVLLVVSYFQLFPFAVPDPDSTYSDPLLIRETHFRVVDVVLVAAVLVYVRCAYRIFGLTQQALPFENVIRKPGEGPTRRPTSHIAPGEIGWLVGIAVGLVLLGQGVWWLVNALEFAPAEEFPLRWAEERSLRLFRTPPPGVFTPGQSRFFVLLGLLFFGFLLVRLVFGYWRLRTMTAAEGALVLTDTSWSESHRERVRVESWRIWGRRRAAEKAEQAAKEERKRRKKEANIRARTAPGRRPTIDEHNDEAVDRRPGARDRDDEDDRPRHRGRS